MNGPTTGSAETLAEDLWREFDRSTPEKFWAAAFWREGDWWTGGSLDVADRKRIAVGVTAAILTSDWMKRHDAEVRAEALREAADALIPFPSNDYGAFPWGAQSWLRDRAALTEESDRG